MVMNYKERAQNRTEIKQVGFRFWEKIRGN